jgi:hypothetical protein
MIPVTTTMVTVTQRQHSCGVQRIAKNLILQRLRNLDSILELMRITTFKIANLLIGLGSLMICTHDVTTLTKRKEMTRYCKSFRYGGKCALGKRFYRSNGVSVPTENGLNIPIMGFSLTSPYNRRCHAPVTSVNTSPTQVVQEHAESCQHQIKDWESKDKAIAEEELVRVQQEIERFH